MTIPPGRPLRVVGDVHGDVRAFAFAADTDRFVIQLGDLVDNGPDSAGALRLMFRLIDEGRGLFLVGNHDRKLGRALRGERVRGGPQLEATLSALDGPLRARTLEEIARAPLWLIQGERFFVHAAFHTGMLMNPPPDPLGPVSPLLSRALFGETTGRTQPDGYPERLLRWVNHIPAAMTVYCGHDRRRQRRPPLLDRLGRASAPIAPIQQAKVFCFFFSKKKTLPSLKP
jgi:protein phosphatase